MFKVKMGVNSHRLGKRIELLLNPSGLNLLNANEVFFNHLEIFFNWNWKIYKL